MSLKTAFVLHLHYANEDEKGSWNSDSFSSKWIF